MKKTFRQKMCSYLVLGAALALGASAANAAPAVPHLEFTLSTPVPAVSGAVDTWSTDWSKILGVTLLAQLDSSGPPAWDMAAHPLVYVSAQGTGYFNASTMSPTQKAPGIAIIDANTYEPVASTAYFAQGVTGYSENHGVGISADGKWIYTQGNLSPSVSDMSGGAVLLVINAATLKVDKIIKTRVHHARNIYDAATKKNLVLIDGWGTFFVLDPDDNHKVVGAVHPANINGMSYLAYGNIAGTHLFASVRTGFLESDGGVAVIDQKTWKVVKRINTLDASPIWVQFTADGKKAYVTNGEFSSVARINTSSANVADWTVDGIANAGTIGPYGLNLSWDDKSVFTIGKGEASHNMGITMGVIDASKFVEPDQYRGWNTIAGEVYTGCLREDHAVVHPDPTKNELWIACNGSFDNVVVDMGKGGLDVSTVKVKKIIKQPNGGSSHGGAIARYTVTGTTWTGELLSDTNSLQGSAVAAKKKVQGLP